VTICKGAADCTFDSGRYEHCCEAQDCQMPGVGVCVGTLTNGPPCEEFCRPGVPHDCISSTATCVPDGGATGVCQ
jgi:hypothetical protein